MGPRGLAVLIALPFFAIFLIADWLVQPIAAAGRALNRQSLQNGVQPGWDGSQMTFVPLQE